jgi:hypothetical protein
LVRRTGAPEQEFGHGNRNGNRLGRCHDHPDHGGFDHLVHRSGRQAEWHDHADHVHYKGTGELAHPDDDPGDHS